MPERDPRTQGMLSTNLGADYTEDELEFIRAMAAYQATWNRRFPAWSEALAVLKSLGYRKVGAAPATPGTRSGAGSSVGRSP